MTPDTLDRGGYALLVHNAVLLTCDPERPPAFTGWFVVGEDGRIAQLGDGAPPAGMAARESLDARGAFVAPGFVSAHSHLFTSASRGLAADESLYAWIGGMTRYTALGDAEDLYWFTRHGAQDFLRNGITAAYDFTWSGLRFSRQSAGVASYATGIPDANYQHEQLRAKVDAGLRHVHSIGMAQGDVPGSAQQEHVEQVVALSAEFSEHPTHLGVAISGQVQWAAGPDAAEHEVTAMRQHGLINQPHMLETPYELDLQRSKFDWYAAAGALGPDLIFGHFIHATDEIISAAADAGCAMSWQPMSNGRLGSGVARIPELRERGVRVGIGLDDQSCTDVSDPFANMRTGIALLRATYRDPLAMPVADMLVLHTRGSAEALGIDGDVGSLRPGRYADFLVVDPTAPDTGPVWDPVAHYVLACSLRNLQQVWVGGRQVAAGAELLNPETSVVVEQTHKRMARLRDAAG